MAKTIADTQTKLAYRLGSTAAPTDTTELSKRRGWMWEAIMTITSDEFMWFMEEFSTDTVVEDQPAYDLPTYFRQINTLKVNDLIYTRTTKNEYEERGRTSIVSLPQYQLCYEYYLYENQLWLLPIPGSGDVPTSYSITLTQTGGTATATSTDAHGFSVGQYVTIAGANQSGYNGSQLVLTVPTTTTFTFAVAAATVSPATGTITATWENIEMWYTKEATEPTAETSSIVIPDKYENALIAYAEGRYWSAAHKRGKAADAFTEFETILMKIKQENFRRKFGQEI